MIRIAIALLIGLIGLQSTVHAEVIASQDFDSATPFDGVFTSTDEASLINMGGGVFGFGSIPGFFDDDLVGTDIQFSTFFEVTRDSNDGMGIGGEGDGPVSGGEGGDLLGITGDTTTVGSFDSGSQGFVVNDSDGRIRVALDTIDTEGVTDLTLTFAWFATETTFEDTPGEIDSFTVEVNGFNAFEVVGDDLETGAFSGDFAEVTIELDPFELPTEELTIAFLMDVSSSAESIFLDSIVVEGEIANAIPEPSSIVIALFGFLAVPAFRWARSGRLISN